MLGFIIGYIIPAIIILCLSITCLVNKGVSKLFCIDTYIKLALLIIAGVLPLINFVVAFFIVTGLLMLADDKDMFKIHKE